jgi:hypothetical protein
MGFELMLRVLQFCTVGSVNENYLQAAASPSLECSCTEAPCENLEKFSKKRPAVRNKQAVSKVTGRDQISKKSTVRVFGTKHTTKKSAALCSRLAYPKLASTDLDRFEAFLFSDQAYSPATPKADSYKPSLK